MAQNKGKNTVSYQTLRAELQKDECRRLYVLYGEEPFLVERLTEAISQLLIAPGSASLDRVTMHGDGSPAKLDLDRLKAEVQTPAFLSKRKLVIVKNSGWLTIQSGGRGNAKGSAGKKDSGGSGGNSGSQTQKERQEKLAAIFSLLTDDVCLVLAEEKVDKRLKSMVQAIEKQGVLAEMPKQTAQILQSWVQAECNRREIDINQRAMESLIDRCDSSMHVLWQEMSKLFLYCAYSETKVADEALIAEISLPDLRGTVFDLTDAISAGDTDTALRLLDTLIGLKQPVQLIAFMLARHLRQLICAAELKRPEAIASTLKVMPFVARRLSQQARQMSIPVLEALYGRCYETDLQVKTGKIADRLALETLLIMASETTRHQLRH